MIEISFFAPFWGNIGDNYRSCNFKSMTYLSTDSDDLSTTMVRYVDLIIGGHGLE